MEPTTEKATPARTLFLVIKRNNLFDVYRNNVGVRYGFTTLDKAKAACESKARSYSHETNAVMRQSTYQAEDVGPYEAKIGQDVWVIE